MRSRTELGSALSGSRKTAELRERGLEHEGFREGYAARDALIRLGNMLRQVREAAGMTQDALASAIGMTQPAISRLESGFGRRGPELDTVIRFVHGCKARLVMTVTAAPASRTSAPSTQFETSI